MINTNWDVDKYKNNYESDEHWRLRRQFMVTHKSKFPEFRLVCLTQVFFNMEFLGCKYPEKTMNLVNQLAREVAEEFREARKGKLKRTFVGAQDAAGAKAKGAKPPAGSIDRPQSIQQSDAVDEGPATKKLRLDTEHNKNAEDDKAYTADLQKIAKTFTLMIPPRANSKTEQCPVTIMHHNFPGSQMGLHYEGSKAEGGWTCTVKVNPFPTSSNNEKPIYCIGSFFASTQREGKMQACAIALENLKKYCNYIEPNPAWFVDGATPEFIKKRTPCNKIPRSYLIMTKKDTGHISAEVADKLLENFKKSSNEDMFFIDVEFNEKEKTNLMNRSQAHHLGFRHFGSGVMLKQHHVCIYKKKTAGEILEEAKKLGWKHPKYLVMLREP